MGEILDYFNQFCAFVKNPSWKLTYYLHPSHVWRWWFSELFSKVGYVSVVPWRVFKKIPKTKPTKNSWSHLCKRNIIRTQLPFRGYNMLVPCSLQGHDPFPVVFDFNFQPTQCWFHPMMLHPWLCYTLRWFCFQSHLSSVHFTLVGCFTYRFVLPNYVEDYNKPI